MAQHEFLPLCDVLFNIISLASYFCDVVFDLVMSYALFERGRHMWSVFSLTFVVLSLAVSQTVSLKWYYNSRGIKGLLKNCCQNEDTDNSSKRPYVQWIVTLFHIIQCGILWRYFKLFIPVDLRYVKHEVRDLCILRLFHAFCEAAPMLLIQLYLLWQETSPKEFSDLNIVSTVLSLFSVCWALASFSKNVRLQNIHRLVLTWLGVISQFLWRLGTVSSRVTALTVYATLYGHWVFLVIGLHWISMFLWLISPKNVFHGENISQQRKAAFSALIAIIYIFSYVNLQEVNPRQKMITFYIIMFLENTLLIVAWLVGVWDESPWYRDSVPFFVLFSFSMGIFFMMLYYKYFHVRRLHYDSGVRPNKNNCNSSQRLVNISPHFMDDDNGCAKKQQDCEQNGKLTSNIYQRYENGHVPYRHGGIPGVFNCRFNNPGIPIAAAKRKKKKPTTFVPPPVVLIPSLGVTMQEKDSAFCQEQVSDLQNIVPFWKNPVSHNHQGGSSENEGSSVGSHVNIQQKLQEKKQKQLAELKIIEEEIKQGKIQRPCSGAPSGIGGDFGSLPRQPIPRVKRHSQGGWPPPSPPSSRDFSPSFTYHIFPLSRTKHVPKTSEILLAPYYLENSELYYGWSHERTSAYRLLEDNNIDRNCNSERESSFSESARGLKDDIVSHASDTTIDAPTSGNQGILMYKSYRMPSDMDSQISLPRSYTLPREFKYYRRPKTRKALRSERFVASTNSSDGDVDSGDETPHPDHEVRAVRLKPYRGFTNRDLHETKL